MNKYLDLNYLKSLNLKPYYFGLGFIQMKLNEHERIHFWHSTFQPLEPEEVHNHRYDFTSKILAGQIVHETWDWTTSEINTFNNDSTHELVEVSCSPTEKTDPVLLEWGKSNLTGKYTMNAGDEYWFEGSQFHRTSTTGAITFLNRGPITQEKALVIRPKGNLGSCPFSIKMTDDQIWDYIADTIRHTK